MKPQTHSLVAWHPVLTDHQAYTYEAFSRQSGLTVIAKVARLEDETRRAQGWTDSLVTGIERQLIPTRGFLRHGLGFLLAHRNQIHVFGSPFENVRMLLLLWLATRLGIECYIISEPYSPVAYGYFNDHSPWRERIKTLLRPLLYKLYVLTLRSGLQGVFTISKLAWRQFLEAGMPRDRLFPFGYFIPTQLDIVNAPPPPASARFHQLRLAFVGSLIQRKGLHTLIAAVRAAIVRGIDIQLDVFGPGNPEPFDFDGNRIRYAGRIAFGQTQRKLTCYDLLVLPSHYDGWGVVVNEAICAGVPVICSSRVGASVLIESFGAGMIFPDSDAQSLEELFVELSKNPMKIKELKTACATAAEAIQPTQAATYMLQVLSASPIDRISVPAPWYKSVG